MSKQTDVYIVGGGPAGLAAAIASRARGFNVTVADAARPPIDKTCGEGLMPDGVAALARLGVRLNPEHTFPFRGIRFVCGGESVEANFPEGTGVGIRRTHLHRALVERAEETGVELLWGEHVTGLPDGLSAKYGWIVGADGENSRVRRWAGLDLTQLEGERRAHYRFGFRRHYSIAPWTDCVEVYWGNGCQIYVTPVGRGEICVAAISRDSHLRLDRALPLFPELNRRLRGAEASAPERGATSATRRLPRVWSGRVALVGDASGSVDAITGEGLRLGFEQSAALAAALADGDLRAYGAAHRRLARRPAFMAALMLSMDRSAWLRHCAFRAMRGKPQLFAAQLAMHVGMAGAGVRILCGAG